MVPVNESMVLIICNMISTMDSFTGTMVSNSVTLHEPNPISNTVTLHDPNHDLNHDPNSVTLHDPTHPTHPTH